MEIKIKVEVENVDEVLKIHKGEIMGFLADVVMSKQKKKRRVEKAVCEQIIAGLLDELPRRLQEEMVQAQVDFELVEEEVGLD